MKNRNKRKNEERQRPDEVFQELRSRGRGSKKRKGTQKVKQVLKSISPYYDDPDLEFELDEEDSLLG